MNSQKLKRIFFQVLIACLVASATLAVISVLMGSFNETLTKALFTILLVALHALLSFSFITNNEKQHTFDSLTLFTNATFTVIALSFVTSIFGVWGLLGSGLIWQLYELYFILLFAILHSETLSKILGKQRSIDKIVLCNYGFMLIVVLMLVPIIFVGSNTAFLSPFYYRLLAAVGIVDATLTIVSVILHKLYLQKHPEIIDPVFSILQTTVNGVTTQQTVVTAPTKKHMNIFVMLLLGYVTLQFLGLVILAVIGRIK